MSELRRRMMMQQGIKQPVAIMGDGIAQISLGMSVATLGSRPNHYIYKSTNSMPQYLSSISTVGKKGLFGGYNNNIGGFIWGRYTDSSIYTAIAFNQSIRGEAAYYNFVNRKTEGYIVRIANGNYNAYYKLTSSQSYSSVNMFSFAFESGMPNVRIWAVGIYLYEFEVGDMLLKPWIENGEVGLMDVNTMTFHGNDAGAGSFTAIYE